MSTGQTRTVLTWLPCWILFATVVSQHALAAETPGNPHYQEALRLYDAIEYEAALLMLDKAAQWPSNTREDRVSIALLEGVLSVETQQPERGKNAFRYALSLDPTARLTFSVSPKVSALLEQVRAELHPAAPPELTARATGQTQPPKPTPAGKDAAPDKDTPAQMPLDAPSNLSATQAHGASKLKLPVAIGGGVVALGGVIAWAKAKSIASRIGNADPSIQTRESMDDTISQGKTFEKLGWALMGLGAVTTAGSLLFLDKLDPSPRLSIAPTPEGAYVSTEWRLP